MYEFLMAKEESEIITEIFGFHPRNDGLEPRASVSTRNGGSIGSRVIQTTNEIELHEADEECKACQIFLSTGSTTLSAGLYLCDIVSTILVAIRYYNLYQQQQRKSDDKISYYHVPLHALAACLALLGVTQLGNFVTFALSLPAQERPIMSAYLLPVIQLKRFLIGIWRTVKCGRGQKPPESAEVEALYAILSAAEAGPQLSLQFFVIIDIGGGSSSWEPSTVLVASVLASLLSAAYNAGRAIMYQSSMRWTLALNAPGIAGGMYTLGSLVLRCTAIASIALSVRVSGLSQVKMVGLFIAFLVVPVACMNGVIAMWPTMTKLRSCGAKLQALVAFYIGIFIGPLYPVVHGYRNTRMSYRTPLAITTVMNMFVDVIALGVLVLLKWSPCNFSNDTTTMEESGYADLTYLSSTLKCPQFLGYVITGVALTLASSMVFICSIAGSTYEIREVERLIPLENRGGQRCNQLEPN